MVSVIHAGTGLDWSSDMRKILYQIKETYVILLLEDYWIKSKPDTETLLKSIKMMQKMDAGFLRLACFPSDHFQDYAYDVIPEEEWCVITRPSAKYRVNLQAGIWNRKYLLELLKDGESAWDFELQGTIRSRTMKAPVLGLREIKGLREVHGPIPYLCTAVTKGVWMYDAVKMAKKENIVLDTGGRPVETKLNWLRRRIYHHLPFSWRPFIDFANSKIK